MAKNLLTLTFCCLIVSAAFGQKPEIVTDRPDQTEAPSLVPKGGLQIETGFIYEQDDNENVHNRNITYNTTLVKYGVNQNFELRLISEYLGERTLLDKEILSDEKGISPMALGVKIRLADERGIWPQASLIGHINVRTGSRAFTPKYTAADFRFTFAHTLSDKFSLSYNAGAEWSGDEESPEAIFLYTASVGYIVTSKVGAFIETYSFFPEGEKADNRLDAGLTYKFSPVVQWDISGGIGLSKNAPDTFISTGISARMFK
jgi:hypothetical protein